MERKYQNSYAVHTRPNLFALWAEETSVANFTTLVCHQLLTMRTHLSHHTDSVVCKRNYIILI